MQFLNYFTNTDTVTKFATQKIDFIKYKLLQVNQAH